MIKIIVCAIGLFISLFLGRLFWDMETDSHIKEALYFTIAFLSAVCAGGTAMLLIYFICTYIE